jgi:hypothetical protein
VQAVLGRGRLLRDARAHDLGQPVDVDRVHPGATLDLLAHRLRPRLGTEDPDTQGGVAWVYPAPLHLVDEAEEVRRRDHDDRGPEVADELDLTLGHPAAHRHDRRAEPFCPVVGAETAREQAVAVGDVHDVSGVSSRQADGASHEVGPRVDVLGGVADDSRSTGGPRAGVHPHHLLARHREHAERVAGTQVRLRRERHTGDVIE